MTEARPPAFLCSMRTLSRPGFCLRGVRVALLLGVTGLGAGVHAAGAADFAESFDGWTDDPSYAGEAVYESEESGIWVSFNALAGPEAARSGLAVRFNDDTEDPWLECRGFDGNGLDGGVGAVSFWYRHWDGDGRAVAFRLRYRIGGGSWIDAGPEVVAPQDTQYRQFSQSLNLVDDDVTLRIQSTADDERLVLDDFMVMGPSGLPVVRFGGSASSVREGDGTVLLPLTLSPAADAEVDVILTGGDAAMPADLTYSPTTVVFSAAGGGEASVQVHLTDDDIPEPDKTAVWSLASPVGAVIDAAAAQYTLSIQDDDMADGGSALIKVMAANLSSGNNQEYEGPGIRIMQALNPDIIGIQEFTVSHPGGRRGFVDEVFGPEFDYIVEGGDEPIPNGVISRWPIIASGEWQDPQVNDRDFSWATIDIPGPTNLHVISVHFHGSGGASSRQVQAEIIVNQASAAFPADEYIVLAGDLNTSSRTEATLSVLAALFSDARVPADRFGNDDTNANRNRPYDYVLPNAALNALHEPVILGGLSYPNGIVFDTRLWNPPPAPALTGDSGASQMQHMAVMKAFEIPALDAVHTGRTIQHIGHRGSALCRRGSR